MDSQTANNSSDFVRKLYKMLENHGDEQVVRWGNDGDSFVVLKNEAFTKHILPKHFKHSNFASFVRQLNKYDFHKVRHNSNEEAAQSPYGAGAWEFKHPDFMMNNKDALDNIRRKAPVPRKSGHAGDDFVPTQQMDMFNGQLVATQQQLQHLQSRYDELSIQHSMLLQEMIGLQKMVVNHEQVMQSVMTFLHTVDAQRRRDSRMGNPFAAAAAAAPHQSGATVTGTHPGPVDDDVPASPLQHATKLLSETNVDSMFNPRNIEHMSEITMRMNGSFTTTPPPELMRQMRPVSRGGPHSASSSTSLRGSDFENLVYPIGHSNGIDPTYAEHAHNIPYSMPSKMPDVAAHGMAANLMDRKKSAQYDPGWIRQPQILLVEDDATCRRIGGKFICAFSCVTDCALDGLEAVNKMHEAKYDLVLMDIIMPNLDGVSACHLIRQFDHTPIIAMTSNIRSDDIQMYFHHGMNDVLPKPFTKEGLLLILDKHLAHLKRSGLPGSEAPHMPAPPVQPLSHATLGSIVGPGKPDDASPSKSSATASNWNSPNQIPGVSPAASAMADDYLGAAAGIAAQQHYGMPTTPGIPGMPATYSVARTPQVVTAGGHRRQITDISGGPGDDGVAKRQTMYQAVGVEQPLQL